MNQGRCSITPSRDLGALKGLELAWDAGDRQIKLEIDSKMVVALLLDTKQTNHQYANLTLPFEAMLRQDWSTCL
ncbi:unnamed protein product [Linum trigynum]|uniref:RNase H type-1 domain-containing protein n=1 Tax=Linum trigynum TaxID=586398 RepID=A0AAV2GQR0_9ROSI